MLLQGVHEREESSPGLRPNEYAFGDGYRTLRLCSVSWRHSLDPVRIHIVRRPGGDATQVRAMQCLAISSRAREAASGSPSERIRMGRNTVRLSNRLLLLLDAE